jgi:hypothetical protein
MLTLNKKFLKTKTLNLSLGTERLHFWRLLWLDFFTFKSLLRDFFLLVFLGELQFHIWKTLWQKDMYGILVAIPFVEGLVITICSWNLLLFSSRIHHASGCHTFIYFFRIICATSWPHLAVKMYRKMDIHQCILGYWALVGGRIEHLSIRMLFL